jgi:hypothetical protein
MNKKNKYSLKGPGVSKGDDKQSVTYVVAPGRTLNTLNSGVLVSGKPITVGSITPGNAGATDEQKAIARKNFEALLKKGYIVAKEQDTVAKEQDAIQEESVATDVTED